MAGLKNTLTEKNLLKMFAGESQARNRYTYFSEKARKEGFIQIADIFEETANQEKVHAERLFRFLEGGMVEIRAAYPAGIIGTTQQNLAEAAAGEYDEWHNLYPACAVTAREEKFSLIGDVFEAIAIAERQHERRYKMLLENLVNGSVFKRSTPVKWRCRHCGYIHVGENAPQICAACAKDQGYFEILVENW